MNAIQSQLLEIAIKESLKNYELKDNNNSLSDLYLYHDSEDNSLVIYDDTDFILNRIQIPEDQIFNLAFFLRQVLQKAGKERLFDKEYIVRPFSASLVDKDFVVIEELFFLDDDTIKLNNAIWKNIEKDLDDFIEKLLQ